MPFTTEEFDLMVEELLYCEPISFRMLCNIADKTLRNKVKHWCLLDDALRSRGYEDDIMQEICIRLMKTTVTYFLLKDGADGPVNYDPKGFKYWLTTVGENIKRDFANKIRKIDFNTDDKDDSDAEKEYFQN
ncbi:MAG: hypothetical protein IJO50_00900, partial [Clostridia bacterium]|nr:hypothetical protein [Clostridia bacterium]